jgi:hypothetical protein
MMPVFVRDYKMVRTDTGREVTHGCDELPETVPVVFLSHTSDGWMDDGGYVWSKDHDGTWRRV